jgi:hypothetical protein
VATPELLHSWARTERFLLGARAHLSPPTVERFTDAIAQFEEFIEHNELGLAFDWLESIVLEGEPESERVLELLALAAGSMGRHERQQALDGRLTKLKGFMHETVPPRENA